MINQINWYEKDTDEVLDYFYNETDESERFERLKYFIQNFPDLEMDWLDMFEDIRRGLLIEERVDDFLFFVNWYSTKYYADYMDSYEFVERDLCNYYLYKGDYEALQKRINLIQQNPVPAIDTLIIRLLFQLIYHGQYQQALNFAEAVWKPIDESDELIGNAAFEFVDALYANKLQQYYESLQNNVPFDVEAMFNSAVEMGFTDDKEQFKKIDAAIKGSADLAFLKDLILQKNDALALMHLNIHFLKFMYHQYNLPFIFSELIWNFVNTTKLFGKHEDIENWFYIDAYTLDRYIRDKYDLFLESNKLEIFGKVWGLNYVIEFLNHYQLIPTDKYEIMKENVAHFKNEMMAIAGSDLWLMNYVFKWPRTGNDPENSSEQLQLFNSTFGIEEDKASENVIDYVSSLPVSPRFTEELKFNNKEDNSISDSHFFDSSYKGTYIKPEPVAGRNDPCPCGSGKKYKKCCLGKEEE